jgi:hypothetical protein
MRFYKLISKHFKEHYLCDAVVYVMYVNFTVISIRFQKNYDRFPEYPIGVPGKVSL